MNFGRGFSIPHENETQIRGPWIPVTPDKPIPTRSQPIPVDKYGNQLGRGNWQQQVGVPRGYLQENQNYNGAVQNFNPIGLLDLNGSINNWGADFAELNHGFNHIVGSYPQAFGNDSAGWNNNPLAELLGIKNPASVVSASGTLNRSIHVANRPLISNPYSQVDSSWRAASLLLANQNHSSGSNLRRNGDSLFQIPQYGFPVPYRPNYNLNSPPTTEGDAASSVTNSIQFAPVTPDQAKKLENQLSEIPNFSVDESMSHEKEKQDNIVTSIGNEAREHRCDELLQNIVDSSSAAISTSLKEKNDSDKGGDRNIDLNKTPQQKPPRKRKHRPKVIIEGKPKRTRKPSTPKNTNSKENPLQKRKYVRKNGNKASATQQADVVEATDPTVESAAKSCRRVLNFDLENKTRDESRGKIVGHQEEMQHGTRWAFKLNSDSQAQELCTIINSTSGTKSAVQVCQWNGLIGDQQAGTTCNLTSSMNQMPTDYISPERHAPATPPATRKDLHMGTLNVIARNVSTRNANPCQSRGKNGYTPVHQHIHGEGIGQVVFQAKTTRENLERTGQLMSHSNPQSVPKTLVDSNQARGPKREYYHTVEQTHPRTVNLMGSSLLCQEIFQVDDYNNYDSSNFGTGSSEIHKKRKSGNGLYTTVSSMPSCITTVEDGSRQVQTKGRSDVNPNHCTSQINYGILNSYFESDHAPKKLNNAVNNSAGDWYIRSMAVGHNFQKQHSSSELHSHTERTPENRSSGFTWVQDFTSLTATSKCNLLPLTPPKKTPTSGNEQGVEASRANMSTKEQTVGSTLSNLASSSTDKVLLREHKDALYDYQQSSMKTRGPPEKQKYPIPIDNLIRRMKGLNLNGRSNKMVGQEQNALVPYKGQGTIVPYEGFDPIKKRKPRPKVDLDPETNRIWKLLMGKEGSEGSNEMKKDMEKWWEEERKVFRGRADSFIARMHLVQGDRRFSQWKGSVVDSVIGVFLTQNVSDHLSSSAFMSLAAQFPLKSESNNRICYSDGTSILVEEPELYLQDPNDTIKWQVSRQPVYNQNSVTHHESSEHRRYSVTTGTRRTSLVGAHNTRAEEEVISSQDSFDSCNVQAAGEIRSCSGSNSDAEDPTIGCRTNKIQGSTSNDLPQTEKTSIFQEFYSRGNGSSLFDETSKHEHKQSVDVGYSKQKPRLDRVDSLKDSSTFTYPINFNNPHVQVPNFPSSNYRLHMTPDSGVLEVECLEVMGEQSISSVHSTASGITKAKDVGCTSIRIGQMAESATKTRVQQNGPPRSQETPTVGPHALLSKHPMHQQRSSQPGPHTENNQHSCNSHQHQRTQTFQLGSTSVTEPAKISEALAKRQNSTMKQVPNAPMLTGETFDVEERISVVEKQTHLEKKVVEPNSKDHIYSSGEAHSGTNTKTLKARKGKTEGEKKNAFDWDSLRKQVQSNGRKRERSKESMDSLDYEAMRCADVGVISDAIKERGMNNMLAERIKDFLNRLVREHESIDLEWLRDAPPDKVKDYLLSIRGLGLKSVECVRLLTLHHLAFPVDTNVGRIAVRLGWVPLQPLPESLQLHLLELYPVLESIQKYLWPRLCKLDQRTLYELHYQMITFGKVFCTKNKPNCNACPLRGECRHFASAFSSARLALPGPEEKSIVSSTVPISTDRNPAVVINPMQLPPPENNPLGESGFEIGKCEPIIEVPATPEPECTEVSESDIEDAFYEDPDEIPTIKLNIEEFTLNLQNYMQENMEIQEGDMSKALVALNQAAASIPTPKLKNVSRLRTEHQVYELPDSHLLLKGLDKREPDDPSPYLLAIWTPGETANSIQPPERRCESQESGKLCYEKTCFSCNSTREENSQTVRGTLLIPCRTAMRGSFPLNGTYFQVNEMFADHDSSLNPINVPRAWIWNLPRRTVYFGTSVSTIFKGLSTEGIQYCFWRGFVCVRGFHQKTRAPKPLMARLHFPASKLAKTKNESK